MSNVETIVTKSVKILWRANSYVKYKMQNGSFLDSVVAVFIV